MKLLILIMAIGLFGVNTVSAQITSQATTENRLLIGTAYKKLEDRFILDQAVKGNTVSVGYSFMRMTAAKKSSIAVDADMGSFPSRNINVKAQSLSLRLSQGFSLLKSDDGKLNSYWGYSLSANPSFIRETEKNDTRDSWSTSNDLSIYQSFVYRTGRNRFTLDIAVPVIGLSSRPPEKSSYHNTTNGLMYDSYSNIFFTSWKNRRAVVSSFDFRRAINKQLAVVLGGRFDYNTLKRDNFYKEVEAGVYGGVSVSFK